jgi:2-polyprenyl-3-methyl-5-hydroxy-6-metoxy-1,4-benzoquinol methylase
MKCRICNNSKRNKLYHVREMMFGYRDQFSYFQCSNCGCLQISEIPDDMSKYYPETYYSFGTPVSKSEENPFKKLCVKQRDHFAVFNKGIAGRLFYAMFPNDKLRLLSEIPLTRHSRILDVGCGAGFLLYSLREIGFSELLGIDPYIDQDIKYDNGLEIKKQSIHELNGSWNLIMFHHSFEHMPDPFDIFQSVSRLLNKKNGVCLISIPTVSSYAWEHYGVNWVNLDAPRHFYLYSTDSMRILAEKADHVIKRIVYNSTEFQFIGSEQYLRDIPLKSKQSHTVTSSGSLYTAKQIKRFRQRAKQLNKVRKGDSIAFFLRKRK